MMPRAVAAYTVRVKTKDSSSYVYTDDFSAKEYSGGWLSDFHKYKKQPVNNAFVNVLVTV